MARARKAAPADPPCAFCGHGLSAHGFGRGGACLVGWSDQRTGGCKCPEFKAKQTKRKGQT